MYVDGLWCPPSIINSKIHMFASKTFPQASPATRRQVRASLTGVEVGEFFWWGGDWVALLVAGVL